jgi:transposase InsO family protein
VIDFVNRWAARTELERRRFVAWLGVASSTFYSWAERYGKVNEHNRLVPRDHWLENDEKQAILDYERRYPLEGYRRLAFMMLDDDVAAASPSTVYRVLKDAGRLDTAPAAPTKKGTGFQQPLRPHEHWHTDVSYLNIAGTFYYMISVLDGYSRTIVHWDIRESMTECDVEIVLEKARQCFPDERPRVITDNGPQFIARDFKEFIRLAGMTHVRTSPGYPQSNGKKERWFGTLKRECIRPHLPLSLDDARRLVAQFVEHYNSTRLHSAVGYVAPLDKLIGLEKVIAADRDGKLEAARERRRLARQAARTATAANSPAATPAPAATPQPPPTDTTSHAPGWLDFRALRAEVSFEPVLRHLGFADAFRGTGPQRRGPCPLHDTPQSRSQCCSVNLRKNLFQCFDPQCRAAGNLLDFWAALHHLPLVDAAHQLRDRFAPHLAKPPTATEKRQPVVSAPLPSEPSGL